MFTNQRMPKASDTGIERLIITSHLLQDCSDPAASTFKVQVNPNKVSYDFGVKRVGENEKGERQGMGSPPGTSAAPNTYQSYNQMYMDFEFFADATGILPIPKGREDEFLIGGGSGSSQRPGGQPSIRKHLDLLQNTVYGYEPEIHGPLI